MHQPIITTLIPTYQRPQLLERAIRSVLDQTYPHLRVSVFDNCSGDATEGMVRNLMRQDQRLTYHCHERNLGAGPNFEFALKSAATEYFTILSDDDWLLSDIFANAVEQITRHPEAGFIALACDVHRDGRTVRPSSINRAIQGVHSPPDAFLALLRHWAILTWTSVVFKKTVLDEMGPPLREPCMPNDLEFLLRIAAHYPIVVLDKAGAVFTDHPQSASSQSKLEWIWPCYPKVIEHVLETYDLPVTLRQEAEHLLTARFKKRLAYAIISALQRQDWDEARQGLAVFKRYASPPQAALLSCAVGMTRRLPFFFRPMLNILVKKKHAIIHLMDTIFLKIKWK